MKNKSSLDIVVIKDIRGNIWRRKDKVAPTILPIRRGNYSVVNF